MKFVGDTLDSHGEFIKVYECEDCGMLTIDTCCSNCRKIKQELLNEKLNYEAEHEIERDNYEAQL